MRWVVRITPQVLYPRESPGTYCIGGWVCPRAGLDGCGKSRPPPPGFDPWTVKPVASHYTDCAIPVHIQGGELVEKSSWRQLLQKDSG